MSMNRLWFGRLDCFVINQMNRNEFIKYAVCSTATVMMSNSGCSGCGSVTSIAERLNNQSKLYNLDKDLSEKNNFAVKNPQIVKSLEGELAAWEQEVSAGVKLRV
jgi:hypothetical protein